MGISLPLTNLVRQIMRQGVAWGQGDRDNTSILAVIEKMNAKKAKYK
jgi:3-hydroxyisobutyrate dehydrogenase-like beta-hydroxyacid dehydrogenase